MVSQKFKSLRSKLPAHCYKLIAQNADGITATQVRLVFYGQITDPEKVTKVLGAAKILAATLARQNRETKAITRRKKVVKTKPRV